MAIRRVNGKGCDRRAGNGFMGKSHSHAFKDDLLQLYKYPDIWRLH